MTKPFFEVFPTLKIEGALHGLLEQAGVERVSMSGRRDLMRVYLHSGKLIQKKDIWRAEEEIRRQILKDAEGVSVKIYERFELSAQYTLENLIAAYRESILEELKNYSHIEYNAFRGAEVSYPGQDVVRLEIKDTVMNREREPELVRVLEKIISRRCGVPCAVAVEYREAKEEKHAQDHDMRLRQRVEEIAGRLRQTEEEREYSGAASAGLTASPAGQADQGREASGAAGSSAGNGRPESGGRKSDHQKSGGTKLYGGAAGGDAQKSRGSDRARGAKQPQNPDIIWGKDFEGDTLPIEDIIGEMGDVVIRGKIIKRDTKEIRNERAIVSFDVTDFTDTIGVKLFVGSDLAKELEGSLKAGTFVMVKGRVGMDRFDQELSLGMVAGIRKIRDFTIHRMDNAPRKRVELHCHTKMSDMDGVSEAKDIVRRAHQWGHKAIAITDHGVVQSFTDANHVWEDLWKAEKKRRQEAGEAVPDRQDFFKILYGVEAYLVDDLNEIATGGRDQALDGEFVVFDIETTGFSPIRDRIIEIGAVKICDGQVKERFSTFVNPGVPIPLEIEKLTGIRDDTVLDAPPIEEALPEFLRFCEGCVLAAHNARFDMSFITENARRQGLTADHTCVDTLGIARLLQPNQSKHTLDAVAKRLHISLENHHRAVDDAECTARILKEFILLLAEQGVTTLSRLNELGAEHAAGTVKKLPSYHAIILAKNDLGRIHLYRLVSESHLTYFSRNPRIPKSLVEKCREGLILGSACEAGELYRALLDGQSDAQIAKIVSFYDYLEVQPVGNNQFMIASEKIRNIHSIEDIREINRRIVELGEQFHKPVAATCDVHFLDPEDEIYRRIIMSYKNFDDAESQPPLYLHTTEEMLEEFSYLGSEKAYEVVVENTNRIADMCESISPVRPDKCPPVIADSDKTLTQICHAKARALYGSKLPDIVAERLERELNSIIKNGFAVMYIIAQKLVWKSVEDGYLVGSRGSVGSSFVATMSGITEINPLSPHYYCSKCHYTDFDSEQVRAYAGTAGIDMPDRVCPDCGAMLCKDGFDIPFETFLGFKGDKEPDIDLNFSGEYQSKAHKYTEVIFGAGQTFRAGTIATLADKTAYGYVRTYFEKHQKHKRGSEIERLLQGCVGVRRSTGQHPGGIVVLPIGQDINSFTPVQRPANDMDTDIITTHFDYHSIDHNLLKLDILGHDDPTMIRMLQDLTGRDPLTIPLDGQEVMSLFQGTQALGITPEQIGGTKLGCLGIPEFGTDFAMGMVLEAKPKCFSDLVRISGLSHGTNVWLGNAQDLIRSGKADISTCVCTRDDIMTYLINKGVEPAKAFQIMEAVRKGMVAKGKMSREQWQEWKEDMQAHGVPDWYIESCEKIEYMFPKAHAAAYVMMAWRIAYCKIHYPLAYYCAFFSIRAKNFSYVHLCKGKAHLEQMIGEYRRRMELGGKEAGVEPLANKEELAYGDMRIAEEMYARGYEFTPIDIFRAKARDFQIVGEKLMPSLSSIVGLGEKAAEAIVEAVKDGPFLSKDDFRGRTGVTKNVADMLVELGLLGDLPESNQLSLFDL